MKIELKKETDFWSNKTQEFSETKCKSCGSTDVEDTTMPEDGELFPIKHCQTCGDWWGCD